MYQSSLLTVANVVASRKFPIWVSCETFPWNNAHESGTDKIGVSGCSADKETIHLLSDHFSHDRVADWPDKAAISAFSGQTKGDGMYK